MIATTVSSRKQKGRKLQQEVRDKILTTFEELSERDVRSTPMGVSGADLMLSEKAFELFPYSVEVKNQEKLNIWASLKQAESDARDGKPLLIFKRNRSKIYCALELNDFLELLRKRE